MASISEDIKSMYTVVPLWEPGVLGELKSQNYEGLKNKLSAFLKELSVKEWGEVYWNHILNGIPSIRGDTDEQTWRQYVLPAVGRAVISAVSTGALVITYASLEKKLKDFHKIIITSIQGETPEQKAEWLRINRPEILNFYNKNVIGLRINLEETLLAGDGYEKFTDLPEYLKIILLSPKTSDEIIKLTDQEHISQEKLSAISAQVGRVILREIKGEDLGKEIEAATHIDHRVAKTLGDELQTKIINPLISQEGNIYESIMNIEEPTDSRGTKRLDSDLLLAPAFKAQPDSSGPLAPASTSVPKFEVPGDSEVDLSQTPPPPPQEPVQETAPPPPPPSPLAVEREEQSAQEPPQKAQEPTPFIIHKEEGLEPLASGERAPLSRPHFFKSTAGSSGEEEAVAARLEIGEIEEEQVGPKVGRTKKENVRVVNYASPDIKVDPFSRQNAAPPPPTPPAKEKSIKDELEDVSENNIVDLKDLPK